MEARITRKRSSVVRKFGWLGVASMLAVALLAPGASPAFADGQSVKICHGTGSNSNPYVEEDPSVQANGATEGQLTGGHSNHVGPVWFDGIDATWGDIIPPYVYAPNNYDFPGLNWTVAGQAIYNNDCEAVTTTTSTSSTSTTSSTSSTSTSSETTSTSSSSSTSTVESTSTTVTDPSTSTTSSASTSTTAALTTTSTSSTLQVEGATGHPAVTLPPTDTLGSPAAPSSDSWRILLIALAALVATALVLTPATASRRR